MVARDQLYDVPLPIVLGHEGAGVVERVGSNVKKVTAGDHVVLTYMWCGYCRPCLHGDLTYCQNFYALNFGAPGKTAAVPLAMRGVRFMTISSASHRSEPLLLPTNVTRSRYRGKLRWNFLVRLVAAFKLVPVQ